MMLLTSFAHDPAIRKLPGSVGGLKARQPMLSSGGEATSISCNRSQSYTELLMSCTHFKTYAHIFMQ